MHTLCIFFCLCHGSDEKDPPPLYLRHRLPFVLSHGCARLWRRIVVSEKVEEAVDYI